MFERPYLQGLQKRMEAPKRLIQVVMGPRQVGITTLASQLADKLGLGYYFISLML